MTIKLIKLLNLNYFFKQAVLLHNAKFHQFINW